MSGGGNLARDELGLRRAMADRVLQLLVAAMAFLAALAIAGWFGTAALARHWQEGARASLTVQVPDPAEPALQPGSNRLNAVFALLLGTPGVASAHALSDKELTGLLKPWLGQGTDRLAIALPAVIAVHLTDADTSADELGKRLSRVAPGTLVEDHGIWITRLSALARSLQACAGLAVALVTAIATAVISLATRTGLAARRDAIEVVHGLGAPDGYIAARFARRATLLAGTGGLLGAIAALPVLLALAQLARPFAAQDPAAMNDMVPALPLALWCALPCLPLAAAAIGFLTAQAAVLGWLRQLP